MSNISSSISISDDMLASASDVQVWDSAGKKVRFGDLFTAQKTIVVFIRHFFCGQCQAFVSQLAQVSNDALGEAQTKIVIIGCGEWSLIENYKTNTGFQGEIYADPTRELYRKLGMSIESLARTPAGQQKKTYVRSVLPVTLASIWEGPLKHPLHIGKQGNISQLGGEFVFGPGQQCTFSHTMQHSEDHLEVADLMKAADVQYP